MILLIVSFLGRKTLVVCCNDSCSAEAFYALRIDGLKLAGLFSIILNSTS